jgi:hypothetical protein
VSLVAIERIRYNDNPTIVKMIVPIGVVSPVSSDDIIAGTELNCRHANPTHPEISVNLLFSIMLFILSFPNIERVNPFFLCMVVLYHVFGGGQALFGIYIPV